MNGSSRTWKLFPGEAPFECRFRDGTVGVGDIPKQHCCQELVERERERGLNMDSPGVDPGTEFEQNVVEEGGLVAGG